MATHADKSVIKTPMEGVERPSLSSTGNVVENGKVGPGLPARTGGLIPEVFYDENASLPKRTGG